MSRFALYHAVNSRSFAIRWLLEEAHADYEIIPVDFKTATHKTPDYLALNPDGKVPMLIDRGPNGDWKTVITESAAIGIYIADALPEANLAPPVSSPLRGPYLMWCVYRAAALEPAFADAMYPRVKEMKAGAVGWPPFPAMIGRIEAGLKGGPWILGESFSAADVVLGMMLYWLDQWGKLPPSDVIKNYVEALKGRDALKRTEALDREVG